MSVTGGGAGRDTGKILFEGSGFQFRFCPSVFPNAGNKLPAMLLFFVVFGLRELGENEKGKREFG